MFKSVVAALRYWRLWQEKLRAGMAIPIDQGRVNGMIPQRENILAVCASIEGCVRNTLTRHERRTLDRVFNRPELWVSSRMIRTYNRALSKLGKEMRGVRLIG